MARTRRDACSFCGKSRQQVRRLVAGPGVFICDQCVALCNDVINDDPSSPSALRPSDVEAGKGGRAAWRQRLLRRLFPILEPQSG